MKSATSASVHSCFPPRRGFTLLELVFVLVVVSLLIASGSMVITGALQSQRLSASASRLANELAAAGIQAIRENRTLEVHCITEQSEFKGDLQVRSCQLYAIDPSTGKTSPIRERWPLDTGVVAIAGDVYSNVLSHSTLSGFKGGYSLRPDGSTDLGNSPADRWCITLVNERDLAKVHGGLPPDYRTLLINPATGLIKVY